MGIWLDKKLEPMEVTIPDRLELRASGKVIGELYKSSGTQYVAQAFTQKVELRALIVMLDKYFAEKNLATQGYYLDFEYDRITITVEAIPQVRSIRDNPQA